MIIILFFFFNIEIIDKKIVNMKVNFILGNILIILF